MEKLDPLKRLLISKISSIAILYLIVLPPSQSFADMLPDISTIK
jgi:hypothetical protein